MITCVKCNSNPAAKSLGFCVECVRNKLHPANFSQIHRHTRKKYELPVHIPETQNGITCRFCSNKCQMSEGDIGFCGLRRFHQGRIESLAPKGSAFAHMYLDPLPTNCCAAWFCNSTKKTGASLAVFFYGCNFNCLFCQNASHKHLSSASIISEDDMVSAALNKLVQCICFFGGSPEPQLPFTLRVVKRIIEESQNSKHICWEWNGAGNPGMVKKAAELAAYSGGTVKFDLKAYHPNVSYALCGVSNQQVFQNFATIAGLSYPDVLTATTLLVPYYVDQIELQHMAASPTGTAAS